MGEPSLDEANVKVAVRVRPMNRRGKEELSRVSLFPIMLLLHHMYNLHTDHFFCAHGSAVKLLAIQGDISHPQHPRVAASN